MEIKDGNLYSIEARLDVGAIAVEWHIWIDNIKQLVDAYKDIVNKIYEHIEKNTIHNLIKKCINEHSETFLYIHIRDHSGGTRREDWTIEDVFIDNPEDFESSISDCLSKLFKQISVTTKLEDLINKKAENNGT